MTETRHISLNRDFARRHLAAAVLFLGIGGWFFYDGAIRYPQLDDSALAAELHKHVLTAEDRETAIDRQFQFAALLGMVGLVVLFGVWRAKRATLVWDEAAMCGTLTGGKPLAFDEIAEIDDRAWERKSYVTLIARDGRRVKLDAWHHNGAKELYLKLKG